MVMVVYESSSLDAYSHSLVVSCKYFFLFQCCCFMSSEKVAVDSVFGKSPDLCTKSQLLNFFRCHRTIAGDLTLPTTGTKAVLVDRYRPY